MISRVSISRLKLLAAIGLLLCGVLGGRLAQIQVVSRDQYEQRATDQQQKVIAISPNRGRIFDRNLQALALNVNVDSYGIKAAEVAGLDPAALKRLTGRIGRLTGQDPSELYSRMLASKRGFKYLARGVDMTRSFEIKNLPIFEKNKDLFQVEREVRRAYPLGTVGGQLVGFANVDRTGIAGVELFHNELLEGSDGFSVVQVDGKGRQYAKVETHFTPALNAADIILTIDAGTQAVAEEILDATVELHQAIGGMIVLIQPTTGEILAMASNPKYDPNDPTSTSMESQKIRPVVNMYEPGSTFKLVAATAALDTDAFDVDDVIQTQNGVIAVGRQVIEDHEKFVSLTVREVIEHSSNVGTIKIARALDDLTLFNYARAFGFGTPTGIGLPGEAAGVLLHPKNWSATTLPTMAIGYGVSVTGLQLANAYCAVANGGLLPVPRIIKAVVMADGSVRRTEPAMVRRVMSAETARTMRGILKGVVVQGTGRKAAVSGYHVAGKTGTAWKAREDAPGYTRNYRSSFVGMFPAENPELVALIVIDEPKQNGFYGGDVAAPAFQKLMKRLVNQPGGPIQSPPEDDPKAPRYLTHLRNSDSSSAMAGALYGLDLSRMVTVSDHPENTVLPMRDLEYRSSVSSVKRGIVEPARPFPAVIGLSLREALRVLAPHGIEPAIVGSGLVVQQIPEPGTPVRPGAPCIVACRPFAAVALQQTTDQLD